MKTLTRLFSPMRIGRMELRNRIVMPAMGTNLANADGTVNDQLTNYYEARARGGTGLIIIEITTVDSRASTKPCPTGIWSDYHIEGWRRLVKKIHAHGAKIALQLAHPGRQGGHGSELFAPSPVACPFAKRPPKELSVGEIQDIIEKFGEGARRAKEAGFDAVELHGAHGYLIAQFMSPSSNKRSDRYGGDLEGRLNFPLEIVKQVRKKVGPDYPVIFRLSAEEGVPDGSLLDESKRAAPMIEEAGVDALHVSAGAWARMEWIIPPMGIPYGVYVPYAEAIKKLVHVPVITVGRINSPLLAEEILEQGKADLVAMGRSLIADPDLPKKAQAGRLADIRPCIGCTYGCQRWLHLPKTTLHIGCTVNPEAGQEGKTEILPATKPKKVLIAGGGPAGLEAARVAALRGHQVTLMDKAERLGGQMNLAVIPPFKQEIARLAKYYFNQMSSLNIKVELGQEVTPATVEEQKPDVIIVATGAEPLIPAELPGADGPTVVTAHDLLAGKAVAGEKVVVIGGGMVGCETADFLGERGHRITLVEMLEDIGTDLIGTYRTALLKRLTQYGIRKITSATVKKIVNGGVVIYRNNRDELIDGMDSVVLALGAKSVNRLRDKMKESKIEVYTIGDASEPGNMLHAIEKGAEIARKI